VTIFVSTAYLDEAERCNRIGLLNQGRLVAVGTPDEVKRLMRGQLLEIRSPDPRRAVDVLRREMGRASAGLFGDRVHLVSTNPAADEQRAREALAAAGLAPVDVRPVPPSLEDVFVSVLSERN